MFYCITIILYYVHITIKSVLVKINKSIPFAESKMSISYRHVLTAISKTQFGFTINSSIIYNVMTEHKISHMPSNLSICYFDKTKTINIHSFPEDTVLSPEGLLLFQRTHQVCSLERALATKNSSRFICGVMQIKWSYVSAA